MVLTILCPLLVRRGHSVTCFNRKGSKAGRNTYKGVKLVEVFTINKRGLAAITSSFAASLRAAFEPYDVVHYHAEGPCAMLWIPKLFGKKCIATVHGLDWQREKWKGGFGSKYIKFGEKILARYADEVIVLSKGVQQYFKRNYGRETVFIPNGVIRPRRRKAALITEKFDLAGDDYFCAVSRLTEEKGIHFLIKAYNQIKTDKKLVICGDSSDTDDYVSRLRKLAGDNPNILFTGFVSGALLDEIYSNAYVYVLPSNLEGMPLSLLEAMSYGNAVIGSNIPEITDVVEDKAVIFKTGNADDLAAKMQLLLDDNGLVKKLRSQSSDYICNKYSWEDIANQTVGLYME